MTTAAGATAQKTPLLQHAPLPDMLLQALRRDNEVVDFHALTDTAFRERASEFEILLTNGEDTVTRERMRSLPALKLIANFGVGYDGIDVQTAAELGVRVTNTPDVLTDDVADLALGLLLGASRQIPAAQGFLESGAWAGGGFAWTRRVSGSRLGIVGMGRIGEAVARRASAFDMAIRYFSRRAKPGVGEGYEPSLMALATWADALVVCLPGGGETKGLVDAKVLQALGPRGILVNVGRGSVVDEDALIRTLHAGELGGAGLDVFASEPHVPQELQGLPNVVLTPHIGSATWQTRLAMSTLVVENITAFQQGLPLVTPAA
ncbi:2-hydroxyacid dehydrogenase [Pseudarthrobacter sp. C4D7]|uniref:2-hydroxyacid dehydrogenase n=1 Tax=Pseudarthrobacter sp. C4D7 TaxID=2735268 RepID=UPI0015854E82|nr:2-hydroxyacid dehydrogenase [Pseudarthrobacter sp. C4D7]NUT73296.1 2-hydroxyacid dehydrogenase [Pseudarthrobacter sp. C4D7]